MRDEMPDHEHDEYWHDRMDVQTITEHLEDIHGWFPEPGQEITSGLVKQAHQRRHAMDRQQEGVGDEALAVMVGPVDSGVGVQGEARRIQVPVRGQMDGIRPIEAVVLEYRWTKASGGWVFAGLETLVQGLGGELKVGTPLSAEEWHQLGPSLGWAFEIVHAHWPRG